MNRKLKAVFLLIIVLCISSCGKQQNAEPVDSDKQASVQEENKQEPEEGKQEPEEEKDSEDGQELGEKTENTDDDLLQSQGEKQVDIYSSNEDATELITTSVRLEDLTAQTLLGELSRKGILPESVKVNSCKKVKYEEKKAIDLDVSSDFAAYLNIQGTTGELITMASLSNTFLKAYDCEAIHITVDGDILASGHAEYPGYMSFFESIR